MSGYRHRIFDKKLAKMGHSELMAEGSDYDDSEPYGVGGVNHSFKLEFETEQITFYADTDSEKANWYVCMPLFKSVS